MAGSGSQAAPVPVSVAVGMQSPVASRASHLVKNQVAATMETLVASPKCSLKTVSGSEGKDVVWVLSRALINISRLETATLHGVVRHQVSLAVATRLLFLLSACQALSQSGEGKQQAREARVHEAITSLISPWRPRFRLPQCTIDCLLSLACFHTLSLEVSPPNLGDKNSETQGWGKG